MHEHADADWVFETNGGGREGRVLFGRERELTLIEHLVCGGDSRGEVRVMQGEPGSGRTSLLAAAERHARANGTRVLSVSGSPTEVDLEHAGLYSLLRPVVGRVDRLAGPQKSALLGAFGAVDAGIAEPLMVGLATLELLTDAAASEPLLLLVDDAHLLDQPTRETLAFVARRLVSERVVALMTVRDDQGPEFADLPGIRLRGLDDANASRLLDEQASTLPASLRALVIELAAGNPLGLTELSASLIASGMIGSPTPTALEVPLGDRLRRAFSVGLADLSAATQRLLLLLACDEHALLAEAVAAAESVGEGRAATLEAIGCAVDAGVVLIDGPRVRFAHPLVRLALYQTAGIAARRTAHRAMSEATRRDRFRCAWHRALAGIGPDAETAAELYAAAIEARSRGYMRDAFSAFERAAWLTDDPRVRTRSLVATASIALELGWPDAGRRLLVAEGPGDDGPESGLAACACRLIGEGGEAEIDDLLRYARMTPDRMAAKRGLLRAAVNSIWAATDARKRASIVETADSVDLAEGDPHRIAILATVGSADTRAAVFSRLARVAIESVTDPEEAFALGFAAGAMCRPRMADRFLSLAIDGLRVQGRVWFLAQALTLRAWARIELATFDTAAVDAREATVIASDTRQTLWGARSLAASSLLAAVRGDETETERMAGRADRSAVPMRGAAAIADVLRARGHGELAQGRHAEAARTLARIYDDRERVGMPFQRVAAIADFAEASVRGGSGDAARNALADLARTLPAALLERSPEIAFAIALVADDRSTEARYREALELTPRVSPFLEARMQLSFGTWLRRERRVAESREPLQSAAARFEALGATPWGHRARQELRATGVTAKRRSTSPLELTPQEVLISQMAATGMSNRQIGQQLFLSPRTVGAHLYRVFPKLGVASRGELHGALSRESVPVAV
jgi:DNA-binding CsgD family transcriptional regulator